MGDYFSERWTEWKKNPIEDNSIDDKVKARNPQWKTTSIQDNLNCN
jgi:hypothetical protein